MSNSARNNTKYPGTKYQRFVVYPLSQVKDFIRILFIRIVQDLNPYKPNDGCSGSNKICCFMLVLSLSKPCNLKSTTSSYVRALEQNLQVWREWLERHPVSLSAIPPNTGDLFERAAVEKPWKTSKY